MNRYEFQRISRYSFQRISRYACQRISRYVDYDGRWWFSHTIVAAVIIKAVQVQRCRAKASKLLETSSYLTKRALVAKLGHNAHGIKWEFTTSSHCAMTAHSSAKARDAFAHSACAA